ncbi:MAG: hypothetical protein U0R50_00660 [Gaiellales bacterium]
MSGKSRRRLLGFVTVFSAVTLVLASSAWAYVYGTLVPPYTGGYITLSNFSYSHLDRTSGTGFAEFGFYRSGVVYKWGCSAAVCEKAYNSPGGPNSPSQVLCQHRTGTAVWSCVAHN